jgi:hypothetical protein
MNTQLVKNNKKIYLDINSKIILILILYKKNLQKFFIHQERKFNFLLSLLKIISFNFQMFFDKIKIINLQAKAKKFNRKN